MRKALKDRPFSYHQRQDGLWAAVDERLGIGAISKTREEAYGKLCAMVLERLKEMSDEDLSTHLAGCEVVYMDEEGGLSAGPEAGASPG